METYSQRIGNFLVKPGAVWNRTYRAWANVELPKYFLKLHQTAPTYTKTLRLLSNLADLNQTIVQRLIWTR